MLTIHPQAHDEILVGEVESYPATIRLPSGLIGFPKLTRFDVLPADTQGPFLWLRPRHKGDDSAGFLMMQPSGWFDDYQLELLDEDAAWLELDGGEQPWLFNIVTLQPGEPEQATVNLIGPIVVRRRDGVGRQVILANHQSYSATQPLVGDRGF